MTKVLIAGALIVNLVGSTSTAWAQNASGGLVWLRQFALFT